VKDKVSSPHVGARAAQLSRKATFFASLKVPRGQTMRIRNWSLALLLGVLTAVGAWPQEPAARQGSVEKYRRCDLQVRMFDGYCYLSMIDLIANPGLFDGKKVMVHGYVHFEFEGDAIYLHKEDFLYGISRNSLWLSLSASKGANEFSDCQDSYALVRGTFKAGIGGHNDMASGELHDIAKCSVGKKRGK